MSTADIGTGTVATPPNSKTTKPKATAATKVKQAATASPVVSCKAASAIAQTVKAISDGSRIQILAVLNAGPRNVGDICTAIGQSQPAISHHLMLLRMGGVVESSRQGQNNVYSLTERGRRLVAIVGSLA